LLNERPLAALAELYQASVNQHRQQVGADSLGWGILGASQMAERWMVDAIRYQPPAPTAPGVAGSWAVGIYSHNERRAQQFAQTKQIPHAFVNLDDLLGRREIQCVYIGSHPRHHFPLTMAALAAGKHVLCETPLALTLDEAYRMEQAAADRGLLLGVNHARRAIPAIEQMRTLLANQTIGDMLGGRISHALLLRPQFQTWRLQINGGGVVFDRTIHAIDLLRFLLADEIAEVMAVSAPPMLGQRAQPAGTKSVAEDVQTTVRLAQHNVLFHLHDSFLIPHHTTSIEVYGSAGTLVARNVFEDTADSQLWLVRNEQITPLLATSPVTSPTPYWLSIYRFNQAVRGHTTPLATANDGMASLAIALAIHQSLEERSPVHCKSFHLA